MKQRKNLKKRQKRNNMPTAMEKKLKAKAKKMGMTGERMNAFVYGTMRKVAGWKPKQQRNVKQITGRKKVG